MRDNSHLFLSDSRFLKNYLSIYILDSTADITRTDIGYSYLSILQTGGSLTIVSSEIHHSNIGIWQSSGSIAMSQSSVRDNTQYGIYGIEGTLTLTNTNFQGNNFTIYLSPAVDFIHSNNTAQNNTFNGIIMNGATIADRIWTKDSMPYIVFSNATSSTVIISQGDTLTIDPGAVVKFAFPFSKILTYGTLNANGTA
ncbi:MAG: hypothetical protein COY19_05730, partial [Candidatus Marinimicrobia bacterium CG_4_10_14_0_2_um_filter_48_9]